MIRVLILLMVVCNGVYAQYQLSAGALMDINNFHWSIAGNMQGHSPNVLSELQFNNIRSIGAFIEGTYQPLKWLEIYGNYQKTGTVSGTVVDTDYGLDNRRGITYHEEFTSNKGFMEAFSAGVLLRAWKWKNIVLKGGGGYRQTIQNYYLLDENDARLRTTYRAKWMGPSVLISGAYTLHRFTINAAVSWQFISYQAVANWNLVREFKHPVSFRQEANGGALEPTIELSYRLNKVLSVLVNGTIGSMRTQKGIDIAYLSDNTEPITRFNGAVRDHRSIRIGAIVGF